MTEDEIISDVEQYVKYVLSLHIDKDACAVLIAKRMLYYLDDTNTNERFCPECGRRSVHGHYEGCKLEFTR